MGRRRGPGRAERGSITVESAIVTASILTFVIGMLQIGILGFLQLTLDAGAFLNAHQNVIGVTSAANPAAATHMVFPQIQASAIVNTVQTAPSPTVPVDYGYNVPSENAGSSSARHGGASIIQPYLSQTTISQTPFSFLNQGFTVHGQATDAEWLETEPEWGVANALYGGTYSATNTQYTSSQFALGDNSPPYYMSLNFVYHCKTPGAWGVPGGSRGVCPSQGILPLGVGEYLDNLNWSNGAAGVGGSATSTGPGGTTGTFEATACHQRILATLAYFFENLKANNYGDSAGFATDPLKYIETTYNPYYYNRTGYTNFSSTSASFFGQWPNGATHHGIDTQATAAVRTIYGWDDQASYNYPPNGQTALYNVGINPLNATAGCV